MSTPDRYAPSRRLARRRLAALARAATLCGVALAVVAPDASAQTAPAAPRAAAESHPPASVLDRPVWLVGDQPGAGLEGALVVNPFGLTPVTRPSFRSKPALADLDSDGDLDVLAGEIGGGFVFYENTAGPGVPPVFAWPKLNPFGLSDLAFGSTPSVADLDSDGDLDVLAAEFGGGFVFYENTAGPGALPAFAPPVLNPFGLRIYEELSRDVSGLSVADLNGDGDLDVLAGIENGSFQFYRNSAGPGAPPSFDALFFNSFGLSSVGDYCTPSVADLDGDGDLDVLAGNEDGSFIYFENTAGPGAPQSFAAPQANPFGLADIGSYSAPTVGDFDSDGDPDVLAGGQSGGFSFFQNTAGPGTTPTFLGPFENPSGLTGVFESDSYSTPSLGDLDSDGDLDVLAGTSEGSFFYYENTAGPGAPSAFAPPIANPFGLSDIGDDSAPSVADLDGDGDLDVLGSNEDGDFFFFQNTAGPGTTPPFFGPSKNPAGLSDIGTRVAPSVGDLDGDGDLDVLAGRSLGDFVYLMNTAGPGATPAFAAPLTNPFGLADVGSESSPAVGDLDGDGDLDLIAGRDDGTFASFQNIAQPSGEPLFASRRLAGLKSADIGSDSTPVIGDLDGDGVLDVLSGASDGNFYFFSGVGAGGGTAPMASALANAAEASLSGVTPNPARGAARLTLALPTSECVHAAVYDALGREVARLAEGELSGTTELTVDTSRLAAGVYVVRVEGETFAEARRLTVAR